MAAGDGARVPHLRIGDAERDEAVRLLQGHLAAGRVDADEFAERMSAALSARTQTDLDRLFVDLPGDKPGQQVAKQARPSGWCVPDERRVGLIMISVAVVVLALMGFAVVEVFHPLMFLILPVVVAMGFRRHPWRWGRGERPGGA